MAILRVHAFAFALNCSLLLLYNLAISGTKGSSGFGSVRREEIDNNTLEIVNAGDQLSFKISKQIAPVLAILG